MNIYFSFHPIPHGEWGEITILEIDHKQTLKTYVQMVCKFKCVHYGPIKKKLRDVQQEREVAIFK